MHRPPSLIPKKHSPISRAITSLQVATFNLTKGGFWVKTFFLFLISLIATSCAESHDENPYTINLEDLTAKELVIDSLFTVNKLIQLETTETSIINQISKVFITEDRIVIADAFRNSVLVFNGNGSFVGKISSEGRGPGEYTRLSDIYVDFSHDKIYILDGCDSKKVLQYTLDGDYITDFSFEFCANSFTKIDSNGFAFFLTVDQNKDESQQFPTIMITDSLFRQKWSGIPFSKKWSGYSYHSTFFETVFSNTSNETYFVPSLPSGVNKVYSVSTLSVEPFVEIDPESNEKIKRLFERVAPEDGGVFDHVNKLDSYHGLNSFFHLKNYLGFSIVKGRRHSFIVHKKGTETYMIRNGLTEDNHHGYFSPIPSNNDILVNVVEASTIKSNDFSLFSSIKPKLKIEDNPILVLYAIR